MIFSAGPLMDYQEYKKMKVAAQDRSDYIAAAKVKSANKKWIKHEDLKKELGL